MSILMALQTPYEETAAASRLNELPLPHTAARDHTSSGAWLAQVDCATRTDVGLLRRRNEDCCAVLLQKPRAGDERTGSRSARASVWASGVSLILADGLGGQGDGDQASAEAVRFMSNYANRVLPWVAATCESRGARLGDELRRTLKRLHAHIARTAGERGLDPAMGTTLTFCHLADGFGHIAHAGDSRCYLLRNQGLVQLTTDHTTACIKAPRARPGAGGPVGYYQSALYNCLGGGVTDLFVEIRQVPVRPGDVLLVCSDGLTTHVSDASIERILSSERSASRMCERLIRKAIMGGGTDDVTVATCRVVDCRSQTIYGPAGVEAVGR